MVKILQIILMKNNIINNKFLQINFDYEGEIEYIIELEKNKMQWKGSIE